jgi:hypothetical protein
VRLISALRAQLDEMTARLAWLECTGATTTRRSVVAAMRSEAAALRRDIDEARVLIDGLYSRYLSGGAKLAPKHHRAPNDPFTRQQREPPNAERRCDRPEQS